MSRRRRTHGDRGGDPLAGIAILFPLGLVFAVGLLLSLWALGLQDLLTAKQLTIVSNPGAADMVVYVRKDGELERVTLSADPQAVYEGTVLGSLYRRPDGSFIYVPAAGVLLVPVGASPTPSASPSPLPSTSPSASYSPAPSTYSTPPSPSPSYAPAPVYSP